MAQSLSSKSLLQFSSQTGNIQEQFNIEEKLLQFWNLLRALRRRMKVCENKNVLQSSYLRCMFIFLRSSGLDVIQLKKFCWKEGRVIIFKQPEQKSAVRFVQWAKLD